MMRTALAPCRALAALLLAAPAFAVIAQGGSPPQALPDLPARSASSPGAAASRAVPSPRLRSPAETGQRAAVPGDLQPERPVAPQLSIPLGKTPPPPTRREERVVRRGNAASSGGVDDAAARCESQTDATLRSTCRARLAREAKGALPD